MLIFAWKPRKSQRFARLLLGGQVLLFHGQRADSFESKDIRSNLVVPSIDRLGSWLKGQHGMVTWYFMEAFLVKWPQRETQISIFSAISWHLGTRHPRAWQEDPKRSEASCREHVPHIRYVLLLQVSKWALRVDVSDPPITAYRSCAQEVANVRKQVIELQIYT